MNGQLGASRRGNNFISWEMDSEGAWKSSRKAKRIPKSYQKRVRSLNKLWGLWNYRRIIPAMTFLSSPLQHLLLLLLQCSWIFHTEQFSQRKCDKAPGLIQHGFTCGENLDRLLRLVYHRSSIYRSTLWPASAALTIVQQSYRASKYISRHQSFNICLRILIVSCASVFDYFRDQQELFAGRQMLEYIAYILQRPLRFIRSPIWPTNPASW